MSEDTHLKLLRFIAKDLGITPSDTDNPIIVVKEIRAKVAELKSDLVAERGKFNGFMGYLVHFSAAIRARK